MSTTPIDFSSIGGKPVQGAVDFSSIGGKPVDTPPPPPPDSSTLRNFLGGAWATMPTNVIVQAGQHLMDWAKNKAEQNRQENLAAAAQGKPQPHSEIVNTGLDALGTYGKYESESAKPKNLAIAAGTMVVPEVAGPIMVGHGLYTAAKNGPAALKGNPDAVESTLGGLSEAAGGGAMTGGVLTSEATPAQSLQKTVSGKVVQAVSKAIDAVGLATPEAVPSLMRAIKPINSKSNFPQTLETAGPELQAYAKSTGNPITNIADLVDSVSGAKKNVWQEYQQRLGPNSNATIDGNGVADAMVDSIDARTRAQNPKLAAQIESTADTYRKPLNLSEAEDYLQSANNELHSYYAKNKVGQNVAAKDPATGHVVAEADALRNLLYDKLDALTGPGTADIKRRYGALSDLQEEALRRKNVADRQSQVGTMASIGKLGEIAKVTKGVLTLDPAEVYSGLAQGALGQRISNLNNTDWLINNAFNGPNAFSPRVEGGVAPRNPVRGLLPRGPAFTPPPADTSGPVNLGGPSTASGTRAERLGLLLPERAGQSGLPAPERGPAGGPGPNQVPPPFEMPESSDKIPTYFRQNLTDQQDMSDPDTRLGAAWHEAGHAIVGEILRPGSIQEVGLDQGGGYTNANTPQGKTNTNQLTPEEIKNLVAVSYAGGMTEPGGTTAQHSSADQSRRADILMGTATSPLSNLARIVTGHTIGPDPMLQANQYQAEAKARVNALLADPNVRAKIDSLASLLNVNGKLSGDQVRAVVRGGKQ